MEIFSSHGLLPSDLVAQSVERRRSNPKVVGSIPTLVRVFLCPCVGPFPSVGLTLTWFIWDKNLALHITLYSVNHLNISGALFFANFLWLDAATRPYCVNYSSYTVNAFRVQVKKSLENVFFLHFLLVLIQFDMS